MPATFFEDLILLWHRTRQNSSSESGGMDSGLPGSWRRGGVRGILSDPADRHGWIQRIHWRSDPGAWESKI